ncbi:DUF4387 domain-containing protein [Geosporobacter ferrireducens]|uniref:DUF4387 domain-containing protein n=1 Tax=Geosporobacter ferrireducens TaxID=1424294 RepID=A0A1D8GK80_9FIRM|nr:DUF4387 domain-containing protein [Geosporobacter ferrireducens]AOT71320.1 hypothetical protein Gferi_18225 [Geosporobacter ferrireducens]MTI57629.1 DUF4387 domain-containing protein [Geosporobacter ferrireducens]
MTKVRDVARYVRSKNAGPFWATLEIFCDTKEDYEKIKNSKVTARKIAELYNVDESKVKVFYVDNINVIKFSFPRSIPQGHKYENDMHFGQQYILLAETAL